MSHCRQLRVRQSRENAGTVQSMENDKAVSHPSHRSLEDADAAGVSHIPPALDGDVHVYKRIKA